MSKREGVLKEIKVTLLDCDVPTINGRIYPHKVVKKAIKNDAFLQLSIKNRMFFGANSDVDYSESFGFGADIGSIAYAVEKLYWYRNKLKAKIAVLDTPDGRILNVLLDTMGDHVKFCTRGTGDVDSNGVVSNYRLTQTVYEVR